MKENILILDDDLKLLNYMKDHLASNNFKVNAFHSPVKALDAIPELEPALIVSDVKMNELTGDDVLNHLLKHHPSIGIILITGFGNIAHSVRAIRKGAFDYITKPFSGKKLISKINQYFSDPKPAGAEQSLVQEVETNEIQSISNNSKKKFNTPNTNLIGQDASIKKLLSILPQIAPTNAPVMIQGESGTGKEVYANLLQQHSNRSDKPFIKINCANLPTELVESTLFGHVKGAFTGATENKNGAFEEANGGTLLLDEVTEIDISLQAKLLRVLQEKEFKRVGSPKVHQTDVRIISTTNRNISEAITNDLFRKDLFFRLNVFPVQIPPLKERKEDIPALADFFCKKYSEENNLPIKNISESLEKYLMQHNWPGNVRELANCIQRGIIMAGEADELRKEHINNPLFREADNDLSKKVHDDFPVVPIEEMELHMIKKALERTNGNQKEAAKLLEISDRTIRNKLKKMDSPA